MPNRHPRDRDVAAALRSTDAASLVDSRPLDGARDRALPGAFVITIGVSMKLTRLAAAVVAALAIAPSAQAITDSEANAGIQFSFANPGARSLGLAGAFIGLADDATAAYTNPAGLTQLVQTEVSIEGRHSSFDTPHVQNGGAFVNPFDPSGIGFSDASSSVNNLNYLSFVFPLDDAAIALYRQELANFETAFQTDRVDILDAGRGSLRAFDSAADLKIVNYGAALGWKASDLVSIGVGLSYYDFSFTTASIRYAGDREAVSSVQVQDGDDHKLGITFGARFTPSERVSLGFVYRKGPQFEYQGANTAILGSDNQPIDPPISQFFEALKFDAPDTYGVGVSYRPTDQWTINADLVRVTYSDLTQSVDSILRNDESELKGLKLDDGTEIRLGAEYTFTQFKVPFTLRGGVWRDPAHGIQYQAPSAGEASTLAILFATPSDDEMHYALGGGFAFKNFQIDLAVDFSDLVDTASVSGVWRF